MQFSADINKPKMFFINLVMMPDAIWLFKSASSTLQGNVHALKDYSASDRRKFDTLSVKGTGQVMHSNVTSLKRFRTNYLLLP